jgi:hypothetical protein
MPSFELDPREVDAFVRPLVASMISKHRPDTYLWVAAKYSRVTATCVSPLESLSDKEVFYSLVLV